MAKKFLTGLTLVNLPSDPSVGSEGELYFNTSASVAKIYKQGAWSELGTGAGGGSTITVSTTAPVSPNEGDEWYKNDTGELFIWDGTYWVEINGTISASGALTSISSIEYPDYITFDTTPETSSASTGTIFWDSGDSVLKTILNANVELGIGQESVALVKNATGSTISKGKVVYINGAQGQRPTIALASSTSEATSSKTFGFIAEELLDEAEGFVVTEGILRGINTNGLTEGGAVWLSSSGNYTQTMPTQPNHGVFLGYVVKANPSSGEIFVKIQNGYELQELHNVLINEVDEDEVLRYSTSASLWINTKENLTTARNYSNATINAFMPVYFDTQFLDSTEITFEIADALNELSLPANGITTASVAHGSYSQILTKGVVSEIDLTGYTDGDLLYVAASGGFTKTIPTGNSYIQPIARVLSTDNGTIYFFGSDFASSVNTLPNLGSGKVWYGTSGRPVDTTLNTTIVSEGSNLYFTDERAQDATSSMITNGVHTGISVEYVDSSNIFNLTNTGATSISGTANEISVSASTGNITIGIPDSPVFVTPDIGVATATSINGTTIPNSASLVVSTDLSNYLTQSSASSTYLTQSSASSTYLTQTDASTTYQPIGSYITSESDPIFVASESYNINSASTSAWNTSYGWGDHSAEGYLTTESDTLETVTDRGATSTNAITISNTTEATNATSGALIVSGGVGVSKDVWIDGNLHVAGTTTTENTKTVATHDNLIYLNAALDSTITNAVFASGSITYTAENLYTAGMDIRITGVDPAGFNIATEDNLTVASATPTYFVVVKADPGAAYVSGGTAHAKEEANPDLGFAGGYYDAGYAHAGLFRDSSDGTFKFFDGYTPEPDESVNIDTGHASFSLADISASNAYFSGSVSGTWNGSVIPTTKGGTGLSSIGTAGQALKVNSTADGLEWGTVSGGGGSSAAAVTSDPPASPEVNQVWQDLDTGRIYVYNGTFWIEVQQNGSLGLLRYLGAASTAPATSIDGSALQTGEVYFDTVFNGMKVYDGTAWEDAFSAASLSVSRWVKTAVGGETSLSGNDDSSLTLVYTPGIEEVYLNGVKLIRGSDYIASSGSVISNLEPLIANSVVEVISYSGFEIANTYTKTEVDDLVQKQQVRWTEVAGAGTSITTLSGSDDYSNILAYTPGTEQVFINGILIARGIDYTATDGTSIVLGTALVPGDIVEVMGNSTFSVANTYTKAEVDSKLLNYIICTSSSKPLSPIEGQMIYETDTNIVRIWDSSKWVPFHRPGEIIEKLASVCDGSTKTVTSGSYTFQNVTGIQATSTTYTDITGSAVSYVPPAGATSVVYRFNFSTYWQATHAINHYKFFIDGVEVVYARHSRSAQYNEDRSSFEWVINIGGSNTANTGRQATWTTPKTLKMQVRQYAAGNYNNIHGTYYWDGGTSTQFSMPTLTIEAVS